MSQPPAFAQINPSHSESPFPGLTTIKAGATYGKIFHGSYTGNDAANVQTIPFLPALMVFNGGPGNSKEVVFVDIVANPPTDILVLTGAATFLQFTGTTGITSSSFDPEALETLTSVAFFNAGGVVYDYWIIG